MNKMISALLLSILVIPASAHADLSHGDYLRQQREQINNNPNYHRNYNNNYGGGGGEDDHEKPNFEQIYETDVNGVESFSTTPPLPNKPLPENKSSTPK